MKTALIEEDVKLIESRLKLFEEATGCELLLVIADAADPYPAAALRFGIISSFLFSLIFSYYFEFEHAAYWPLTIFALLVFMTWIGHFSWAKKLSLSSLEVERECNEKAVEYFYALGASLVTHKVTAMIMVAVLERKIEVRIDEELKEKISQEELDKLVKIMLPHFKEGHMATGLIKSMETLESQILRAFNGKVAEVNPAELSDTVHFISV